MRIIKGEHKVCDKLPATGPSPSKSPGLLATGLRQHKQTTRLSHPPWCQPRPHKRLHATLYIRGALKTRILAKSAILKRHVCRHAKRFRGRTATNDVGYGTCSNGAAAAESCSHTEPPLWHGHQIVSGNFPSGRFQQR